MAARNSSWTPLLLGALCILLWAAAEAHELPSLDAMLRATGIGDESLGALTEEQRALVDQMSNVYEQEDNLHDREQRLLREVGSRRPDGAQKGKLQVMFNEHLGAGAKLGELANRLKASVAAQRAQ